MKFGPVTPELTLLICVRQLRHGQKTGAFLSNISRYTRPIFGIFLPYESTLRAHDGSVPYFLIFEVRCHGNQIMSQKRYQRRLIPLAFIALMLENELQYQV